MKQKNVESTVNLEIAAPEEVLNLHEQRQVCTLKKNMPRVLGTDSCKL